MNRREWLIAALAASQWRGLAAVHPQFPAVRKIYFLPMTNGLDQYLANRLAQSGTVEVVTDPQKADALFTDSLGMGFEKKWDELYPPPPPPEDPAKKKKDKTKDDKASDDADDDSKSKEKDMPQPRATGFRRGKGTVFLVSRASREVVWSAYLPPRNSSSKEVEKAAEHLARRFSNDRKPPAK